MPSLTGLVKLLRPRQWTKNLVCLGGVFFSGNALSRHADVRAGIALAGFCAASGFVYIINDVLDREQDGKHPRKKLRPVASGEVSVRQALGFAAGMLAAALALGSTLGLGEAAILGLYIVMNIAYSLGLKTLSLVDAMVVAAGFILRVYAGTVAVSVAPSAWLLLCTLFLALFLAFGKRRAEINAVGTEPEPVRREVTATRAVLHKYNVAMLDRFCNICATLTIATYALFTVLGHTDRTLIITTPPVVMGIFRYLLLVERYQEGEAPDAILLKDWAIQLAIVLWGILYVAVIYFGLHIDVQ
ncbi:MAG TPA: decaprenyl-phosphate phosphoribosyltransferase [Chthoniobacteraceae bacterium]|jgi:4-hydroxybenzoate polyprenyltransferase|nr:decaprenyl-phosphate phosphoribosyltransferase [Chthoniobacteraceae bacterium]